MPAKGMCWQCSDEQLGYAVDFMLEQAECDRNAMNLRDLRYLVAVANIVTLAGQQNHVLSVSRRFRRS